MTDTSYIGWIELCMLVISEYLFLLVLESFFVNYKSALSK